MTDSRALDADRLPWLTNDARPVSRAGTSPLVAWAVGAVLLVAGASYWAGRTAEAPLDDEPAWTEVAQETVRLPQPSIDAPVEPDMAPVVIPPTPQVQLERDQPSVAPAAPSAGERAAARVERQVKARPKPAARSSVRKASVKRTAAAKRTAGAKPRAARRAGSVAHWPRPADAAPLGRIIRIGTYSTPTKNHRAWQKALRRYPQIQGLPKIVGVYRAKNGKTYYPLYIMTTARAQSDWLCRKMKRDWRSCTVMA